MNTIDQTADGRTHNAEDNPKGLPLDELAACALVDAREISPECRRDDGCRLLQAGHSEHGNLVLRKGEVEARLLYRECAVLGDAPLEEVRGLEEDLAPLRVGRGLPCWEGCGGGVCGGGGVLRRAGHDGVHLGRVGLVGADDVKGGGRGEEDVAADEGRHGLEGEEVGRLVEGGQLVGGHGGGRANGAWRGCVLTCGGMWRRVGGQWLLSGYAGTEE